MLPPSLSPDAAGLLRHIGDAAVRALGLACAMAVALAALRVKRAAVRLCAWTVILYAALAMPLLDGAVPGLRWSLPRLAVAHFARPAADPAPQTPAPLVPSPAAAAREALPHPAAPAISPGANSQASAPAFAPSGAIAPAHASAAHAPLAAAISRVAARPFPWAIALLAIYAAGVLILLLRAVAGWAVTRRLARLAIPLHDASVRGRLRVLAALSRVKRPPLLAEAKPLLVPLTLSVLRPTIMLPADWRRWDAAKLDAVLAHELAHIARGDLFTQRLSLLHRAFFWFSPLGWWLHHGLAELAEQASDEAALDAGADQAQYAETLLGFFARMHSAPSAASAPRRVRWQALAMARGSGAERRVERILAWKDGASLRLTKWAALGIALLAVPAILLSAALRPAIAPTRVSAPATAIAAPTAISPIAVPALPVAAPPAAALVAFTAAPVATSGSDVAAPAISDSGAASAFAARNPAPAQGTSPPPAAPQAPAAGVSPCGPAINECRPLPLNRLEWLKTYADRTTFEVTADNRFPNLMISATPDAVFHLGYDMALSDAIGSMLSGPAFPVQLRDGRYLMIYAQRGDRARGESFYWFDLQQGVTFGGIFFYPANGEPTPTLTIFSRQVGDRLTSETQLPAAFQHDLESWRAARNVPVVTVRYFVNASAWKSVLLHDPGACAPAGAADTGACRKLNEQGAEADMQASFYLLRIRYAEGTPARIALQAAQDKWAASRDSGCSGKPDVTGCRAQMTRARAQELFDLYSQAPDRIVPRAY